MAKPQKLAKDPEKRDSAASTVAPAAKADQSPAALAAATQPMAAPASPGPEAAAPVKSSPPGRVVFIVPDEAVFWDMFG